MNTKLAVTSIIVGLTLAALLPMTTQGQPSLFVIDRADAISYLPVAGSSELNTLIAGVQTRFVVEHANAFRILEMAPAPSELRELLGQIDTRFVLLYANASRIYAMGYPQALIGDTLAPQITEIVATGLGDGKVKIVWTTDEFADSLVTYGLQSGIYTGTASDPSYVRRHEVILSNISAGTSLYFWVGSIDRSGNARQSAEQRYIPQIPIYIPLVVRPKR